MAEPLAASLDQEDRGQVRRQQILDAAATCFVREGFHGASIARIARAAGMSPGNLYHFFASKESIIAALVQRRLDQSLALFAEIEAAADPVPAMLERIAISLELQTDPAGAALGLEILAEAGRNPVVAGIVRTADKAIREHLTALYPAARLARGLPGKDAEAATEVLVAIFQGLPARVVSHPEFDRERLIPVLRQVLAALF